jgi:uncharacterized protein (AIM24 family)
MPGTTARKSDPANEEAFVAALYKGGELLAAGNVLEAREHLEKAHELEPKNEKAQNLLGLAYFKLGLFDQASHVYELLVRENPADPTLRVNLGLVYLKSNNLDRAVKEFETATDLEPGHKKAHNYLGLALAQVGDYAKAREHFTLAGSDQMAEKMEKALVGRASAQATSSGLTVPSAPPATAHAVTNEPAQVVAQAEAAPRPPPPEPVDEAPPLTTPTPPPVQDEAIEVMNDEVVDAPPEAELGADWGSQMPVPPPSEPTVIVAPMDEPPAIASDDEMRFAEDEGPSAVTDDAPLMPIDAPLMPIDAPLEPLVETGDLPMLEGEVTVEAATVELTTSGDASPPAEVPAWLKMEASEHANAAAPESPMWVTETVADVPMEGETTAMDHAASAAPDAWEQAQEPDAATDEAWTTTEPAQQFTEPTASSDDSWASVGEAPSEADQAQAAADQGEWTEQPADQALPAEAPADDGAGYDYAAQAPGAGPEESSGEYTGSPTRVPEGDDSGFGEYAAAPQPSDEPSSDPVPEPRPSVPVIEDPYLPTHHDVAANLIENPPDPGPVELLPPPPPSVPSGPLAFAPLTAQRLGELGATSGWVQDSAAGPFQLGTDGLAVTVAGEMLVRMTGLVAVVGGLQVAPEMRRKRGRATNEPFGAGPAQLQRVSGHGVVYLEATSRFHAVDLTDQPGVSVDDEGAYLRESLVFGFEEAVSFENGRLAADALTIDLVHLKGHGRVLLQLEGSLKAMAVPPGAPMVVPLSRLVGWFGRVTPRLVGFGGQGAVELTGDGFALLGTPG